MFAQPSDRCTFSCARISFFASSEKLLNQRKPPRRLFSERQRTNNGQHHTGNFQQHPHQQPTKREREREREIKSFSLSSSFFFFSLLLSLPFPLYVWILLEYDFAIFVLACCYFSCVDPNRGSSCSHEFLLDTLEVVRDLKTQRTHLLVHENVASLELHQRKRRLRARHESIATRLLALALATTSSVRRKRVSAAGQTRAGYASSTSSSVHRHSPPPFHLSAFSLSLSLSLLSFLFGTERIDGIDGIAALKNETMEEGRRMQEVECARGLFLCYNLQ